MMRLLSTQHATHTHTMFGNAYTAVCHQRRGSFVEKTLQDHSPRDHSPVARQRRPDMALGFDQPLYILPFDHRGSFQTKMFGWSGTLTSDQTAQIAGAKQIIYDGFKIAITGGVSKPKAGILVDEQFGAAILKDAAKNGYSTSCPAEKSGQDEFDFEYGEDFAKHIEAFHPTFCKVLVRYNSEGDKDLNRRQS